jgi:hypothetical protein
MAVRRGVVERRQALGVDRTRLGRTIRQETRREHRVTVDGCPEEGGGKGRRLGSQALLAQVLVES